ncbi:MAG: tRNA uridine-5-carboxymethylaminomethyl(34) synthesis GTPase MnmE, partial [Synergistaceae bacterium]|nr:tRNA uridine-5-carboxymethylaminomethyl(34) synthesis GTPase MnmE [Synergistaceae bacterium]
SIIVFNKADLETKADITCEKIHVSAKNLSGIEELKSLIYERASRNAILSDGLNVSSGQLEDIRESLNSLKEAKYSLMNHEGEDITAGLINSARVNLLRVIGLDAGDELLDSMFSRFCVGK